MEAAPLEGVVVARPARRGVVLATAVLAQRRPDGGDGHPAGPVAGRPRGRGTVVPDGLRGGRTGRARLRLGPAAVRVLLRGRHEEARAALARRRSAPAA